MGQGVYGPATWASIDSLLGPMGLDKVDADGAPGLQEHPSRSPYPPTPFDSQHSKQLAWSVPQFTALSFVMSCRQTAHVLKG